MTELKTVLTSLYDSMSEAELQALQHGQHRLAKLLESGSVPPDTSVPVYHATNMEVTLDVGLEARQTESGLEMHVTEPTAEDGTRLTFTVDLYDLLDRDSLADLEYDDIFPGGDRPGDGDQPDDGEQPDAGSRPGDGDTKPEPANGVVDVETLQLGAESRPPWWFQSKDGTPGAIRLFDTQQSVASSSLIKSSGERAPAVRDFVVETDFETSLLLQIVTVGPNSCYTAVSVSEFAIADDELVGSAAAVDTSGPDEECLSVIQYPSVLVRVTVADEPPEVGRFSVTDGMGNEAELVATPETGRRTESDGRETKEGDGSGEKSETNGRPAIQPVEVIGELDPRYAELLRSRGIETIGDIVDEEPEALAERLNDKVPEAVAERLSDEETEAISPAETRRWLEEARGLESMLSAVESEQPVELIKGIGPTTGTRLREHGIEQLADLVATPPAKLAEIASTDRHNVSKKRARTWLEAAVRQLEETSENGETRR